LQSNILIVKSIKSVNIDITHNITCDQNWRSRTELTDFPRWEFFCFCGFIICRNWIRRFDELNLLFKMVKFGSISKGLSVVNRHFSSWTSVKHSVISVLSLPIVSTRFFTNLSWFFAELSSTFESHYSKQEQLTTHYFSLSPCVIAIELSCSNWDKSVLFSIVFLMPVSSLNILFKWFFGSINS